MSTLLSFFLFLILPILFSSLIVKRTKYSKYNHPPSPPKLPIIGNLHQLRGSFHRCLHNLAKKHGPVLLLRLGFVDMVVISSMEAAEIVLKVHDLECCTRPKTKASSKFLRNAKVIAFEPYGEAWKELRKLSFLQFYSTKKVRSFKYIREEESDLMIKKLMESAQEKKPVDLSNILFCFVGSIIFRSTFGQRLDKTKHINKEKIEEFMFEAQTVTSISSSDLFPAGFGWFMDFVSGKSKRLHKLVAEIDTLMNNIIDDHLKNPEDKTNQDRPDIIDSILDIMHKQEEKESFKFTIDHLKGIIQNIYLAGVDTTAITMIWAMAELVKNPRVMKKAQDEIRKCIRINQNERIKEEDVDKLQYLKLVIKETLRLHPAGPLLLPRETMADISIQGYDIPRNTLLVVNAWSIGQNPRVWEDPEEFNPDRFIDCPLDYKGNSFEMLPFGSGRRICPGIAYGIATFELGLLNLLYFFDWKLPDENKVMDMEEAGGTTIVKKVPLELIPVFHH